MKNMGIDNVVAIHVAKVRFPTTTNQRFGLKCVLEWVNCRIGWVSCAGAEKLFKNLVPRLRRWLIKKIGPQIAQISADNISFLRKSAKICAPKI